MPIRAKTFGGEPLNCLFSQIAILKAASTQDHARLARAMSDRHNRFHEHVVKLRGDEVEPATSRAVIHQLDDRWLPIHHDGRLTHEVEGITCAHAGVDGELQLHCRLAFETCARSQADNPGDGIEEASGAAGERGVDSFCEHLC